MELLSILFAIIISFGTFGASLYGLHLFWLKPYGSEIPNKNHPKLSVSEDNNANNGKFTRVSGLSETLKAYIPLITNLDTKYWISNVGIDGYTYLFYQRELMRALVIFGLVACIIWIPITIWNGKIEVVPNPNHSSIEVHNETLRERQELRSIIDCILVYFFSLYTAYVMFHMKKHVRKILLEFKQDPENEQNKYEFLKSRSVHVRGLFPEDRKGIILVSEINSFLDMSSGGRIVSTLIIPDFLKIVDLENNRKRIDNAHKLYIANEPAVRRIFFPKKYRDQGYYDKKLRSIDDKIEDELMKPLLGSGHAFVCFDSVKTKNHCLRYFREDTKSSIKAFFQAMLGRDSGLSMRRPMLRRMTSTFQKFDEEAIILDLKNKGIKMVMNPLESPHDLFWSNMGGTRGLFLIRRIIINVIAALVLLFLSTPASLLTALKQIQILKFVDVSQYVPDDTGFGGFIKQVIPPLLIILLNQLLLFLIDYAAYMEKHRSITLCQISIFFKSLLYLTLNMLIIPALTLATADSLFKVLVYEGSSVTEILKQFYFSSAGSFFIIILFQNGAFSASFHMLRLSEVINTFGSTWLAHYQRNYLNDSDAWRKNESDVFQYGYFYAQILSAFAITISYSVSTPVIIVAGISFLWMRYLVDGFNLLTVYKMEIDSDGHMVEPILKYTIGSTLLLQIALAISFGYSSYKTSCFLISVLFCITLFLLYKISGPIYREDERRTIERGKQITQNDVNRWETAYRHPLLVAPTEMAPKESKTLNFEFPRD